MDAFLPGDRIAKLCPPVESDAQVPGFTLNRYGRRAWAAICRKYIRRGWSEERAGIQALKDVQVQGYVLQNSGLATSG